MGFWDGLEDLIGSLFYRGIVIISECLETSWNNRDTQQCKHKLKMRRGWVPFTSGLENWAFTGKAVHRENIGDQRFQVSLPIILNHCHKKEVY